MAAFASCRRSGWVRFLVVLLCALFVFATLGAPAARAEALTVGLFTAAAVLSAATAALGFKLANSADGQATLAKMVQDFKVSATAVGLVLVGSKINGLIDGVDYIKMQVKAGKTYLDERVVAWVQQWLASRASYDSDIDTSKIYYTNSVKTRSIASCINDLSKYNYNFGGYTYNKACFTSLYDYISLNDATTLGSADYLVFIVSTQSSGICYYINLYQWYPDMTFSLYRVNTMYNDNAYTTYYARQKRLKTYRLFRRAGYDDVISVVDSPSYISLTTTKFFNKDSPNKPYAMATSNLDFSDSSTGISGSDTIGKDVVDKSLDEVLAGLKEWAPDWWDAGADSSTNGAAAGTKDLPLNMGSDVKTVTGNPALEVDQPLIYTPWFDQTLDNLRNGETAGTVTNTATSAAETADKAEAAEGTVEDAQDVVQSIISWGLDYISPDKGLFSRFPLCIPYDAYLLVTAALGVDAQDLGDIVGQSPGDISAQIDDGVAVQSDFFPVISVKHDWTQDGVTTPVEVTIDLRPYDGVIKMIRTLVSVYVIAELIASEYKRIRGS